MTDLSPETVGKLVALARRMAAIDWQLGPTENAIQVEAAAIVAELPEPMDPDRIEGERLAYEMIWSLDNDTSIERVNELATAAIKRGRALAGGDWS